MRLLRDAIDERLDAGMFCPDDENNQEDTVYLLLSGNEGGFYAPGEMRILVFQKHANRG